VVVAIHEEIRIENASGAEESRGNTQVNFLDNELKSRLDNSSETEK
jgi:hypothetical protein